MSVTKYPHSDAESMQRLWKRILDGSETDEIWRLYKTYVSPGAPRPIQNCQCLLSVSTYYDNLRDWWSKNSDKFE